MTDVPAEVEQQLANMDEPTFSAFVARVRAPDTTEALRTAVSKHVSADQLNTVMAIVNPAAFVGDGGRIDATKVQQHLSTLFGTTDGPTPKSGAGGRAEAAKRFGTPPDGPATSTAGVQPPKDPQVQQGRPVRDPGAVERELQKRFGDRRMGKKEST
jgi:hypothetical protein